MMSTGEKVKLAVLTSGVVATWAGVITLAITQLDDNPDSWLLALLAGGIAGMLSFLIALLRLGSPVKMLPGERKYHSLGPVRIELESNNGRTVQIIDLPASPEQLQALGRGILAGGTMTEARWTGAGGIFTRAEFVRLRDEMIRRNLAHWSSPGTPARGVLLSPSGRAIMRRLAESPTPEPGQSLRNALYD